MKIKKLNIQKKIFRLAEYTNPEIEVQKKKFKFYTIVNSLLIATSDRPEVKIDWSLYKKSRSIN